MLIPDRILEQLKFHCEAEGIGMFCIQVEDMAFIVIGGNDPNTAAIMGAYTMLRGVVSNNFEGISKNEIENEKGPKH